MTAPTTYTTVPHSAVDDSLAAVGLSRADVSADLPTLVIGRQGGLYVRFTKILSYTVPGNGDPDSTRPVLQTWGRADGGEVVSDTLTIPLVVRDPEPQTF